jgi:hypothetical protein
MSEQRWSKTQVCAYTKSKRWKCSVVHEMQIREQRD